MKKSVILIISVIYLASILIVGLMGIKMRIYNEKVYVESIHYLQKGVKDDKKSTEDAIFYKKDLATGNGFEREVVSLTPTAQSKYKDVFIVEPFKEGLTLELKFETLPYNATERGVVYSVNDDARFRINGEVVTDKNYVIPENAETSGYVIFNKNADGNVEITFIESYLLTFDVIPLDGGASANVRLTVQVNAYK